MYSDPMTNHLNYSWGAPDHVNERYAGSAPDPYYESFCDYEGDQSFEEFKADAIAQERASRQPLPRQEENETWGGLLANGSKFEEDDPF